MKRNDNLPNLPHHLIDDILSMRRNKLVNDIYNNYNTKGFELYQNKPLSYLKKFFDSKKLNKENKDYIRRKFMKLIIRDKLISKILNEFSNMGMPFENFDKEIHKLTTNISEFEKWANPRWMMDPSKLWKSLWKKYKSL